MKPNFYGSLTQCTTIRIGDNADGNEVHLPFKNILPMVNPADLIIGGWDISSLDMYSSLRRAAVLVSPGSHSFVMLTSLSDVAVTPFHCMVFWFADAGLRPAGEAAPIHGALEAPACRLLP